MKKALGFIGDFRSYECAVLALHLIMEKQEAGLTYRQILEYPGFLGLFLPSFLDGKDEQHLIFKLKNMVRDVRETETKLPPELLLVQATFRNRKRPRKTSKFMEGLSHSAAFVENGPTWMRAGIVLNPAHFVTYEPEKNK